MSLQRQDDDNPTLQLRCAYVSVLVFLAAILLCNSILKMSVSQETLMFKRPTQSLAHFSDTTANLAAKKARIREH